MSPTPPDIPSRSNRTLHTFLLIAVVVLLAAILIVLVLNTSGDDDASLDTPDATSSSSSKNTLDKPADTPQQVVHRFMRLIMEQRDVEHAKKLMCDDYQGLTPKDLLEDVTEWESDNGINADATVTVGDSSSHGPTTVKVRLETGAVFVELEYEITVEPDGDSFQVCGVRSTSPED